MDIISKSLCVAIVLLFLSTAHGATQSLFREYIGADSNTTKFTDVPINPSVEFHFILSFTIDYNQGPNPTPTNGKFTTFWSPELTPLSASAIKKQNKNVKLAVSLGGDTVTANQYAYFQPTSVISWVKNAVITLTPIIRTYGLDGIDIDYEHFKSDPNTFAECIGLLITELKKQKTISFASIAPFDSPEVKDHYLALWRRYGNVIDYVNFQFYAYDEVKSAEVFLGLFEEQVKNYEGGRILASFATDDAGGGLKPDDRFFEACRVLKKEGKLGGIFVWSADDSKKLDFVPEIRSQQLLASP